MDARVAGRRRNRSVRPLDHAGTVSISRRYRARRGAVFGEGGPGQFGPLDRFGRSFKAQRIGFPAAIARGERLGRAPETAPAIEDMRALDCDLVQLWAPPRPDVIGVVMGGVADRRVNIAAQRLGSAAAGGAHRGGSIGAGERPVASEAELAPGRALRSFEDDAAYRLGEGRMAHAVEDDLHDRALVRIALARFGKRRQSEASGGAFAIDAIAREREGRGLPDADGSQGHGRVPFTRGLGSEPRPDHARILGIRWQSIERGRGGGPGGPGRQLLACHPVPIDPLHAIPPEQRERSEGDNQHACDGVKRRILTPAALGGHIGCDRPGHRVPAPELRERAVRPPAAVPVPSGPRSRPAHRPVRASFRPNGPGRG